MLIVDKIKILSLICIVVQVFPRNCEDEERDVPVLICTVGTVYSNKYFTDLFISG